MRRRTHTHTQSHPYTCIPGWSWTHAQSALFHRPSPFIYSVKHDTCINSERILELCVFLTPYVFLSMALSSPITTAVSICRLPTHHKGARRTSLSGVLGRWGGGVEWRLVRWLSLTGVDKCWHISVCIFIDCNHVFPLITRHNNAKRKW